MVTGSQLSNISPPPCAALGFSHSSPVSIQALRLSLVSAILAKQVRCRRRTHYVSSCKILRSRHLFSFLYVPAKSGLVSEAAVVKLDLTDSSAVMTPALQGCDAVVCAVGFVPGNPFEFSKAAHAVDNVGTCALIDGAIIVNISTTFSARKKNNFKWSLLNIGTQPPLFLRVCACTYTPFIFFQPPKQLG